MTEIDDEVAKRFAQDEPITDDGTFVAAVRQRVAWRRRWRRLAKIGLTATLSAAATALVAFAPGALAYPAIAVEDVVASPLVTVLACAAVFWWNRSQET